MKDKYDILKYVLSQGQEQSTFSNAPLSFLQVLFLRARVPQKNQWDLVLVYAASFKSS